MYISCTPDIHHMYTSSTPHLHLIYTSMYTSCTPHVHLMYTWSWQELELEIKQICARPEVAAALKTCDDWAFDVFHIHKLAAPRTLQVSGLGAQGFRACGFTHDFV